MVTSSLLSVRHTPRVSIVTIRKRIAIDEDDVREFTRMLSRELLPGSHRHVYVDFGDVDFVASQCLWKLYLFHLALLQRCRQLTLCRVPPQIEQTCVLMRVRNALNFCDEVPIVEPAAHAA